MAAGAAGTTTTSPRTMRAAVMHEMGGPEVIKVQSWPIPTPQKGQVLIRVKAFGINRSDLYAREGSFTRVNVPRILGIEAVGLIEEAPGNEFSKGDVVATAMGGMGRSFDGGYAEYTCVPANQVLVVKTKVPWEVLGALPEMMQTAWGSLFRSLQLVRGDRLLIRGGTSSVGLAAAAIAKNHGAFVAATTRKEERVQLLRSSGADEVFIDNGSIAEEVRKRHPEGFNKILELVGVTTYEDSLRCADENGIVCMTGIVGGKWEVEKWSQFGIIPTAVCLTTYASTTKAVLATPLDELAQQVLDGKINVPIITFSLDQIVEAHRCLDESTAGAKIEYWAWTYDELASYDLEALIGFIYDRRGATKLTYVGHSEGSLLLFAGLTGGKFKTELLGYLNAAVLLAPAASIPHLMAPLVKVGLSLSIDQILIATGNKGELDSNMFLNLTCTSPLISQFACSNTFYGFLGQNNHLDHSRLGFYSQYYPQPTSSMSLNHLGQAYRTNTFEFYDKGTAGNEAAYGQPTPPKYDLTTFPASLPLQLWHGGVDGLADPTDFQSTLALLPSSNREVNTLPDYGHVDFTYGTSAYIDVYPGIITFLTSHAS